MASNFADFALTTFVDGLFANDLTLGQKGYDLKCGDEKCTLDYKTVQTTLVSLKIASLRLQDGTDRNGELKQLRKQANSFATQILEKKLKLQGLEVLPVKPCKRKASEMEK